MSAIVLVLLVVGFVLAKTAKPTSIGDVIAYMQRGGPTKTQMVAGALILLGWALLTIGIAIKLWGLLP